MRRRITPPGHKIPAAARWRTFFWVPTHGNITDYICGTNITAVNHPASLTLWLRSYRVLDMQNLRDSVQLTIILHQE